MISVLGVFRALALQMNEKNEVCWFRGILSLVEIQVFTCEALETDSIT